MSTATEPSINLYLTHRSAEKLLEILSYAGNDGVSPLLFSRREFARQLANQIAIEIEHTQPNEESARGVSP